jgi:hypothetical protein
MQYTVKAAIAAGQPAISVDTKEKEYWLFAYIAQNWGGKPLVSHQVIVPASPVSFGSIDDRQVFALTSRLPRPLVR